MKPEIYIESTLYTLLIHLVGHTLEEPQQLQRMLPLLREDPQGPKGLQKRRIRKAKRGQELGIGSATITSAGTLNWDHDP